MLSHPASVKNFLGVIALFAVMVMVWVAESRGNSPSRTLPSTPNNSNACPFRTPSEWQHFLERYANDERWVETCEDSTCDHKYYSYVRENIQSVFEKCSSYLDQHDGIAKCTKNMMAFVPVWLRQHDGVSYGFAVDNHSYLQAQESPDKPPGMMKVPEAIVAALPSLRRVEMAARENGLKYLTHDSALGGTRTFVFLPDSQGRFDQWMLLNLSDKPTDVNNDTPLSLLAIQKKDALGNPLPRVRLHFRDYTITRSGPNYQLSLFESNNGKCFSCHANGVRQLIARRTPVLEALPVKGEEAADRTDFAYRRLMEFDRKLRSYGAPDWDGMIHPESNGPVLGKAQGCTDCHNGQSRSVLTVLTSPAQLEQKIVAELSMPPDGRLPLLLEHEQLKDLHLTGDEAQALKEAYRQHSRLYDEFYDSRLSALKEWFLETSCR